MGQRGKKSTAGLPAIHGVPTLRQRLEPPPELTPDQAETWRAVVASRPADWFDTGSAPLLAAYCVSVSVQRTLATAIEAFEEIATPDGVKAFGKLLALKANEAALCIRLATAMRLSQHARREAKTAATAAREGASTASALWSRDHAS